MHIMRNNKDEHDNEADSTLPAQTSSDDSAKLTSERKVVVVSPSPSRSKSSDNIQLSESARISNNVRTILLSLFALIGFIVLVFAIFAASVNVQLAQIAVSAFIVAIIAAIIGAFALFGLVVFQIRGKSKEET
jgi:uncharacterized membrane protein